MVLNSIDSTNNYAAKLLRTSNIADRSVILSLEQTNGRGQFDRKWNSEPGQNLTFTIVLKDLPIRSDQQFIISQLTAVSLAEFVESELGANISLKWPNDVLVDRLKISGILIENGIRDQVISHSCIGIGLNINQLDFGTLSATSFAIESGNTWNLQRCLSGFIDCFESNLNDAIRDRGDLIRDKYRSRLYQLGVESDYDFQGKAIKGTIKGVDLYGRLKLHSDGELLLCQTGDLQWKL
jgi:BirA family biotin operon repressor/biotin-[acetyl-CoA-carboxylase] ligase